MDQDEKEGLRKKVGVIFGDWPLQASILLSKRKYCKCSISAAGIPSDWTNVLLF